MTPARIGEILSSRDYPGRGILLGASPDGTKSVCAYFITGRSENSRNRILARTEDGIRTQAFDPSKTIDPSLTIYSPAREINGFFIVSNGDQTDTVRDYLSGGKSFEEALETREYEPDGPHFTPRISGLILPGGAYKLSILKKSPQTKACFRLHFDYSPIPGFGHFICTYQRGGDPLPPFEGDPIRVRIPEGAGELASEIRNSLDDKIFVSLFVRYAGARAQTRIINRNGGEERRDA